MQPNWSGARNLAFALWLVSAVSAQEFARSLTPAEFAAAGLDKLTPAELARLDALVAARHGETVAVPAPVPGEQPAQAPKEVAAAKPDAPSLFDRMRVVLKPGTEIAYEAVETQLRGEFRGYQPGKVLTLANGQRWRVIEGTFWAAARDATKPRRVIIEPGVLGSFFLDIEDGGRPKVKFVGAAN